MKDRCEICKYSKVYNEDKEYSSILDMIKDEENNYLICTNKNIKKIISKEGNFKNGSFKEVGIYPRVDDDYKCEFYKKDSRVAKELRVLGGVLK